ncbi:MAG: superoxide dismutase [Lachnospiraceae bacterium]|nr:superoxide dismutase [Lachnospiraceae bacterium]
MYEQIRLPYAFDTFEPAIDTLTMETHYGKHHATYTKNLNDAAEKAGVADRPIEEVLADLNSVSDETLRKALRNNGGGFYNHNLYFRTISPNGARVPDGALAAAIDRDLGGFEALKEKLASLAATQFGSGWSFLSADKDGRLFVTASPNQDNPISEGTGRTPIACVDVWEHAYYLKYKNLRPDYIKAYIDLIDWRIVGENYAGATV